MIATIKAKDKNGVIRASFEAMKMGIELDAYDDNCFDITVHSQSIADSIANFASGKIIAVQDRMEVGPYYPVEELM